MGVRPPFGLGQFQRYPQVDFAQDLVELLVPRAVPEVGSDGFQPQPHCLVEAAAEQASLSSSSASSARLPRSIARRRRSPGSSTPCKAIKALMPARVRNAIVGLVACGASVSEGAKRRLRGAPDGRGVRSDSEPTRSADAHASTLRLHGQWVVKCHRGTGKNGRNRRQNLPSAQVPRADAARQPGAL
jgi:hypothetical protein